MKIVNKLLLKKIFYFIDNSYLRVFLLLPYILAKFLTISFLSVGDARVWIRNSYYLKTLIVGVSDLDISVQFNKKPSRQIIGKLKTRYKILRYLFPFLGEMNLYIQEDEDLLQIFNRYEMKRDPVLGEKVNEAEEEEFQKITFLVRMLESDKENLKNCPEIRQKKWKSHLEELGRERTRYIHLSDIVDFLSSMLKSKEYEKILLSFLKTGQFHFDENREYAILFPHRWAVWVNVNGGIEEGVDKLKLSEWERRVVQEMIKWEIMGLSTQMYLLNEDRNMNFYLDLLRRLNLLINSNEVSVIDRFIDQLIQTQASSVST
ncbi:hypothetical protein [Halobacteriovorax marinus]|uniref:hypothetical protein n=1 Tax=Halobacteriovorax marinus TaxID=97084 RepID=UPI003A93F49C